MILGNGTFIYDSILKKCVKYVNDGWKMSYKVEDVVGFELGETYAFIHFNKDDYTKDAYPIALEINFK